MRTPGLIFTEGRELARMIRAGELSAEELMRATLAQIEKVNGELNAIPTLRTPDDLVAAARDADRRMARGEARGALHGIPIGVKDLAPVAGMRSTSGSPIFAESQTHTDRREQADAAPRDAPNKNATGRSAG